MKQLLFILLLTPTLLFAQKKTATRDIKIRSGKHKLYLATFNGIYDDTISPSDLLSIGRLQAISSDGDTARITSFTLSVGINGSFIEDISHGPFLNSVMINHIMQTPKGCYILFKDIDCKPEAGSARTLEGFFVRVDSAKQPIRLKRKPIPAFVVTLDGMWKNPRIQLDTLIKVGKLNLLGTFSDSTKITGFTLAYYRNGNEVLSYNSANESLTPKMITALKEMKNGYIEFRNIKCKTEEGIKTLNKLTVQVYP